MIAAVCIQQLNPQSEIRNPKSRLTRIRARDASLRHVDRLRMNVHGNDPLDFDVLAVAVEDLHVLGVQSRDDLSLLAVELHAELAAPAARRAAGLRESLPMPLSGSAGVSNSASNVWMIFWTSGMTTTRPSGSCCVDFGERADRHDAFGPVVKFVRLPTVGAQLLGRANGRSRPLRPADCDRPSFAGPRTTSLADPPAALVCRIVLPRNVAT